MADTDWVLISAVILCSGSSPLIQQRAKPASAASECWLADWPRKEATGNNLDSLSAHTDHRWEQRVRPYLHINTGARMCTARKRS